MALFVKILGSVILAAGAFLGGTFFTHAPTAGNFNPTGGGTYLLQSSISSSQSTIVLTSFQEPGSSIPYTMSYLNSSVEYGTIAPSSGTSEFISFTGITQNVNGTATLTGVLRGLSRTPGTGGCVASTTLARAYPGQTQFILSNSPCFYSQYAVKANDENISGTWNFQSLPTTTLTCSSPTQFCPKSYIDAGFNQGAATSSFTNIGLVWLASLAQQAAGTASSSSGAPLVLTGKFASSTWNPSGANLTVITGAQNTIAANFISTTSSYNWTGNTTFVAATSTNFGITNGLNWGGSTSATFFTQNSKARQASSTVLTEDGTGGLSFEMPKVRTFAAATPSTTFSSGSTTILTVVMPANTMKAGDTVRFYARVVDKTAAVVNCTLGLDFGNGAATTTTVGYSGIDNTYADFSGSMMATSTTAESIFSEGRAFNSPSTRYFSRYTTPYDITTQLYFSFTGNAGGSSCIMTGYSFEVLTN